VENGRKRVPKKGKMSGFIQKGKMDIGFFSLVIILLTVGLLMLFSSSYAYALAYFGDSYHFIKKQLFFAAIGFVIMMIVSKIDYHFYRKIAWIAYIGSAIMLAALLILPPMVEGATQKRWMVIGPINFQPSEFGKIAIIILFSHLISANYKQMKSFKFSVLVLGFLLAVICGLVVVETHLSATILIFCIGVCLMIVGGLKGRYIGGGAAIGVGGVALMITTGIVGYGSDRFKYWLDPWADAKGKGYQQFSPCWQ